MDGDWFSDNVRQTSRVSGQFMSCPVFNRTENIHEILFEFHVMRRRRELCLNSVFWCKTDFRCFTLPTLIVLFSVLFVCNCVPYYCHRVSTRLQLTNICVYICLLLLSLDSFLDMNMWARKLTRNPDYVYNSLLHTKTLRLSHLTVFPPLVTVQNTIYDNTRSCSPDDGHSDARNMLR